MYTLQPLSKNYNNTSRFTLASAAFDKINYRAAGAPTNSTLTADTPKGVLAGMVATVSGANDWEAKDASYNSPVYLGLFANNSEGNAFENAPAAASGIVPIFMGPGVIFDVFVFETHSATTPYASILGLYTYGKPLYCSPFGLLTPEVPTALASPYNTADGNATPIASVCRAPTASDLRLGIRMSI